LRQTKTKYSSAEEYLPKAFHFSKWKAFFASATLSDRALLVAERSRSAGSDRIAERSRSEKRKTLAEPLQQGPLTQTNKHKNYFKML
jgi:hypothetical protein